MNNWIIYAVFSAIFAALVAIFGKIGIKNIDSTLATSVRAIIMGIFLTLVSLVMGKWKLFSTINNKAFVFIVFSGIAGALSWLFYFLSLNKGTASQVAAIDRTSIIFIIIFAALFLGESFTLKTILGGILILIGTLLVVLK